VNFHDIEILLGVDMHNPYHRTLEIAENICIRAQYKGSYTYFGEFEEELLGVWLVLPEKTIEITDTGMVFASVHAHAKDGHCLRRVGSKQYYYIFTSLQTKCNQAHAWADKRKILCQLQEVQYK